MIADVSVVSVDVSNKTIRVAARSTTAGSACSGCGNWSIRVHSSYLRFPADVPSAGRRVVLCLRVRRFACPVASCGRRTFVEQVPGLTRRYGRWTERLRSTLAAVGLALAGQAGARMAGVFGVSVSRSTLLRLVEALPEPDLPAPRVVGVDEYATRKGRHYGTVLVDVETRRPVDLLVATYWRTNLTLRQVAPLFGVSKSAADRIDHLAPLLAISPARRPRKDTVCIVDGTLVPTRDRNIAASRSRSCRAVTVAVSSPGVRRSASSGAVHELRPGSSAQMIE